MKKNFSIFLLVLLLLSLTACHHEENETNSNTINNNGSADISAVNTEVDFEFHRKGAENPTVILEEYSDFFCPHCASAQPLISLLLDEYKDKLALEYHHYSFMGSKEVHVANECAGEQDKFWEYHELAFEKQYDLRIGGKNAIIALAKETDLDTNKFSTCIASGKYDDFLEKSKKDAKSKHNIYATPTFLVNGKAVEFDAEMGLYEGIKAAIDKALISPLA
jgi:protein-disulfide isomerase